jgi:hypothetical protein
MPSGQSNESNCFFCGESYRTDDWPSLGSPGQRGFCSWKCADADDDGWALEPDTGAEQPFVLDDDQAATNEILRTCSEDDLRPEEGSDWRERYLLHDEQVASEYDYARRRLAERKGWQCRSCGDVWTSKSVEVGSIGELSCCSTPCAEQWVRQMLAQRRRSDLIRMCGRLPQIRTILEDVERTQRHEDFERDEEFRHRFGPK